MIATKELIRWLQTLPEDSGVAVDEGGLTLVCSGDPEAYLEVGGVPLPNPECPICCNGISMEEEDDGDYVCGNCTRRWFYSSADGEECLQSRRTKVNLLKIPRPGDLINDCIRPVDMGPPTDLEWDRDHEEPKREDLTCFKCGENTACPYAWDWYNTNGDCLAMK